MPAANPNRPVCPECGREMVYLVTNTGPEMLCCFVCDCKNTHLTEEIEECRADLSPEASLVITYQEHEVPEESEHIPQMPEGKEHLVLEFYCPN